MFFSSKISKVRSSFTKSSKATESSENKATSSENSSMTNDEDDHIFDVIIVGSGWAGLSAANHLQSNGVNNFLVLEAKDHVGGRAYTVHEYFEGNDIPVDMGAMWIHGGSKNLLNDYAQKFNVQTRQSDFEQLLYRENNGGSLQKEEIEELYKELFDYGFFAYQEKRQHSKYFDESLQKSVDKYLSTLSPQKQQFAKAFIRNTIAYEYSAPIEQLSLHWWDADLSIGGEDNSEDFFVTDGYSKLIAPFAAKVQDKIVLEAPVSNIDYTDKKLVRITYTDKDSRPVVLTSKKIITTVPLGVLQSGLIEFTPSFPKKTQKSIDRLGMGNMNKIFMFWKAQDKFWPAGKEVLTDVTDRDTNFLFFSPSHAESMLFAFFQGDAADKLEQEYALQDSKEYENRIRDLAVESLQSMFGKDNVPIPEKVIVTNWNADPYIKGAYSFNKVGMSPSDRDALAKPIGNNQLYIAGEASHSQYFATTTGAYLSGETAAKKVIKSLKRKK